MDSLGLIVAIFVLIFCFGVFLNVCLLSSKKTKIAGKIVSFLNLNNRIIFIPNEPIIIRCGFVAFKEKKDRIEIRFENNVDHEMMNKEVEVLVTNNRLMMDDHYQGQIINR